MNRHNKKHEGERTAYASAMSFHEVMRLIAEPAVVERPTQAATARPKETSVPPQERTQVKPA